MTLQCEMSDDCKAAVTHIEDKGFIYCRAHAERRRKYVGHRNRKLRPWELALLRAGHTLPSYKPKPKSAHAEYLKGLPAIGVRK